MTRYKLLWVLIDGLGDVALPQYQQTSPLAVAHTPTMDALADGGLVGLLDPVEPGLACGSDTAHMSLFGYEPRKYYRGRGAFETMGTGLPMIAGDIAFKCNFATLDPATNIVISRRADRNFEMYGPILCDYLDGLVLPSFPEYTVAVKYATEHRCGIRVRGPGLSDCIVGTDPLKDNKLLVKCVPTDDSPEALKTSQLVNELNQVIHEKLIDHPINKKRKAEGLAEANCILLRGCGSCIDVPSFEEMHHLKGFMIAPTCIIAGLGMTIKMDIIEVPGATGNYFTDFHAKFRSGVEQLTKNDYDIGFVHIKAVDDAGHDKSAEKKKLFLEKIDVALQEAVAALYAEEKKQNFKTKYLICINGDHSTPIYSGDHSFEPVPFLVSSVDCMYRKTDANLWPPASRVKTFEEISVAKGPLGRFPGNEVMVLLKKLLQGPKPAN